MEVIEHFAKAGDAPEPAPAASRGLQRLLQHPGTARAILLCSLTLTLVAVWAAQRYAERERIRQFERRADEVHQHIAHRAASHEGLLRGGVALFTSSGLVSREAWRVYVDTLHSGQHQPGIQGLGVAQRFEPGALAAHESAVRSQGMTGYEVWPPGPRADYSAIVYLEPGDRRNVRALGFDMQSEAVRREAMHRARDTGRAAMSGVVRLVQEDGQGVQPGVLLYLPIYRDAEGHFRDHGTADDLWGWVYAPFRLGDLMAGMLGEIDVAVGLQLTDHAPGDTGTGTLLHRSGLDGNAAGAPTLTRSLNVGGREWRATYSDTQARLALGGLLSASVAAAGVAINLLLWQSMRLQAQRRREAEQLMRESQAQAQTRGRWLDAVSGLSPDGALVFERDGTGEYRLMFTNPAFSRLFDLRPADLLGLSEPAVDEWLSGLGRETDPVPPLGPAAATLTLPGPPLRVLSRTQREDATQRVYYFSDITQESEVDRLKSEFIATAAHELRTPLASVYGYAELLARRTLPEARRDQAIQVVHRQAGVLKHLVDELTDMARLDARGKADFAREPLALKALLQTAIESLSDPTQPNRVTLNTPVEALWAAVDASKLRQVVVNLLSNAFKFSALDAPVAVVLRRASGLPTATAAVQVIDQGIGMSAEQCDRAFERFYRADPSGHVLGAGLGLSIAREITELHGGRIELRSRPGEGTTVTLLIPLVATPSEAELAPTDVARADDYQLTSRSGVAPIL